MTQTVTTTRTPHQGYNGNRGSPQNPGYAPRNTPREQEYASRNNAAPQYQEYSPRNNTTPQRQEYAPRINTSPQHQELALRNSATSQDQDYALRNNAAGISSVNEGNAHRISMSQPYHGESSSKPRSNAYDSPNLQDEDEAGLARQNSIPRKQIGASANIPYPSIQPSSPLGAQTGHSRQQSAPKPLPPTPAAASRGYNDRQMDSASPPSSILNRSRPIPTSQAGPRDAQDVVDRAKTDTYDTQVVETVAPGQSHFRIVNN